MADEVRGRGKLIVAVVVIAAVVGAIAFALGRDDRVSTPVEDAVAGRPLTAGVPDPTDSDPGEAPAEARPQGREAPDSQEGRFGAGSPQNTRETPALNPGTAPETTTGGGSTGRNNPRDATATPQSAPTGSLTDGPNADPARSREPGRP